MPILYSVYEQLKQQDRASDSIEMLLYTNHSVHQLRANGQKKISGCFRTSDGADIYCIIRSYLATLHKQGTEI